MWYPVQKEEKVVLENKINILIAFKILLGMLVVSKGQWITYLESEK